MQRTNRDWLPVYCNPNSLLPKVPETRALFTHRPFLIQDFIGKALSFLESDEIKKMGFHYDPRRAIPCRWKCSDESLFGVDLTLWAFTKSYPFNKGKLGGRINTASLGAAVHHGSINIDIGGSHVGYLPGSGGGSFGKIWRPAERQYGADCGYLTKIIAPFRTVYDDACNNIFVTHSPGERVLISIPNEYVQPTWSSGNIKLLVDLQNLTDGEVDYKQSQQYTHTMIGRSLFYLNPDFLERLGVDESRDLCTLKPKRIGRHLTHRYFNMWDTNAEIVDGLPRNRILLYMKFILSARHSPESLKAAVVNTAIEHNRLTDAVRSNEFREYDFISFSGIFIDYYSTKIRSYVNLFQPMGLTIKPSGRVRERGFSPEEIHEIFNRMPTAEPAVPLEGVLGYERPTGFGELFTYEPGNFTREHQPEEKPPEIDTPD